MKSIRVAKTNLVRILLALGVAVLVGWAFSLAQDLQNGLRPRTEGILLAAGLGCLVAGGTLLLTQRRKEPPDNGDDKLRRSEIRYRRLFEAAHDGILILEPNAGRIVDVNPFMMDLLGYKREEFVGKELWEIGLLKDKEASQVAFNRLQKEGCIRYEDIPLASKTQGLREVEFISNIYQENGHKVIQCNVRDVSERKEVEARVRRSERRYRSLVLASAQVIWSTDAHGQAVEDSVSWRTFTGQSFPEFRGAGWLEAIHPEDRLRVSQEWTEAEKDQRILQSQYRLWGKGLGYRWMESRAVPILNREGTLCEWVAANTDITELREAQEHLKNYANDLEIQVKERTTSLRQKVAELETVSYSLSHDLRAPLRAIAGFARIVEEDYSTKIDAEGQDYLRRISRSAQRLDRLIADVLAYSRIGNGGLRLAPVNVEELVRVIVREHPALSEAQIEMARPLLPVLAHEASLSQCLSNLLVNAIKFVPRRVKPRVCIWTEPIDDEVRLWVEDNGIGIAPEHQQMVFGMFQRLHDDQTYEGTGIGLAIVHKAVERMGGKVGVESEVGKGSRFWVQLRRGELREEREEAGTRREGR
jgi:PAS domain S-box-containing protein